MGDSIFVIGHLFFFIFARPLSSYEGIDWIFLPFLSKQRPLHLQFYYIGHSGLMTTKSTEAGRNLNSMVHFQGPIKAPLGRLVIIQKFVMIHSGQDQGLHLIKSIGFGT